MTTFKKILDSADKARTATLCSCKLRLVCSLQRALENYLKDTKAFPEEDLRRMFHDGENQELKMEIIEIFGDEFIKVHALQHVAQAWVLTEKYYEEVEKLQQGV